MRLRHLQFGLRLSSASRRLWEGWHLGLANLWDRGHNPPVKVCHKVLSWSAHLELKLLRNAFYWTRNGVSLYVEVLCIVYLLWQQGS